jgi:hypothetical protein
MLRLNNPWPPSLRLAIPAPRPYSNPSTDASPIPAELWDQDSATAHAGLLAVFAQHRPSSSDWSTGWANTLAVPRPQPQPTRRRRILVPLHKVSKSVTARQ